MTITTTELDWRGMRCPEPILKTARSVRKLRDGNAHRVQVLADDDAFPLDIESWCSSAGISLLGIEQRQGYYEAILSLEGTSEASKTQEIATIIDETPEPSHVTTKLDCLGMACPEPVLKLARVYRQLKEGEEIEITADDAVFPLDLRSWLKSSHAELIDVTPQGVLPCTARLRKPHVAQSPSSPATEHARSSTTQESSAPPQHKSPTAIQASSAQKPSVTGLRVDLEGLSWQDASARLESMTGPAWRGESIDILTFDAGRQQKVVAWLSERGHELVVFSPQDGLITLRVAAQSTALVPAKKEEAPRRRATYLVIHNDFESLMAALMVANTAAAQNMETSIFFSFWGVNLLRGDRPRLEEKQERLTLVHRMFRMMMPRGPRKQPLSKMHFGGMGKQMMLASMRQQNIMDLETLMEAAIDNGVKFTVCTMSMNIMGIHKRDIMDRPNIEFAGVSSFVADSARADASMVF